MKGNFSYFYVLCMELHNFAYKRPWFLRIHTQIRNGSLVTLRRYTGSSTADVGLTDLAVKALKAKKEEFFGGFWGAFFVWYRNTSDLKNEKLKRTITILYLHTKCIYRHLNYPKRKRSERMKKQTETKWNKSVQTFIHDLPFAGCL